MDTTWLSKILDKERDSIENLPRDHRVPSDTNNPGGHDKRTLAIDLHDWQSRHTISTSAVNDLLVVLQKHFKDGNFPIIDRNPLLEARPTSTVRNNIASYVGTDSTTEVIHVCKNDCVAFHGIQSIKGVMTDCSELINCPVCNMQRFSKCTHINCRDASYEDCSPFEDKMTKTRGHPNRVPMKTAYYRPITAKLLLLYKTSLTSGNHNLLKYMDETTNGESKCRVTREGCIIDTCDGTLIKEHNKAMLERFRVVKDQYERENANETLNMCSILLTIFYDGMILFERDSDSIWPMLCSVLNCDPTKRSKLGVGLFLNMLHNISVGSGAEQYLVDKILTNELAQLEKGIIFKFEHPENPSLTVAVFLQARCVFAHLDTIALQKFAKIQGAGSASGCKCRTIKGSYRHCLKKQVYMGERAKLHKDHYLRNFGPAKQRVNSCMLDTPAEEIDFYTGGPEAEEKIKRAYPIAVQSLCNIYNKTIHGSIDNGKTFTAGPDIKKLYKCSSSHPPTDNWYNYMFPLSMFEKSLSYATRDRRQQLIFEDCNMSNDLYLQFGAIAEQTRENWEQDYWNSNKVKPKQTPSHAWEGVNGICSLMSDTMTMKITNLTYDIMHICENLGGYYNDIITGHRGMNDKIRGLCVALNVFPFMGYKNLLPPWRVTENCTISIDSVCNCFLLPVGYKSAFGVRWPCRRNGQLRAKEHMIMIMSFNYYLYSFTKMKSAYRNYFARMASDLCRILNPCLPLSELADVIKSVYETRALFEGLFPESEQVFIQHELCDVVNHIIMMGAARGILNFNGERSLSTISSLVAKGGVHPILGVYSKYMSLENIYSRELTVPFQYVTNDGKYSDFVLKMYGKKYQMKLLSLHELDALLKSIINVILTSEMDEPIEKSALYRLYVVFKICKSSCGAKITFAQWLLHLHSHYQIVRDEVVATLMPVSFRGYLKGICHYKVDPATAACKARDGIILITDFDEIISEVATFTPIARKQVFIKGVNFSCRGIQFREGQASPGKHVNTNPLNNLAVNWYKDDDSSSWACVNRYYVSAKGTVEMTTEFVQLNLVYRLNFKSDQFLHGLAFADACVRYTSFDNVRRKYFTRPTNSFNNSRQYVCLNNVCGSAIGLSILDKNNLPIVHQNRFHSVSWTRERDHLNLAPVDAIVNQIYFLELHPERIDYMYGLIEEDLDHTKAWELD